ncbi:unnamed protein product [Mesocestoides corti]|nr:unnamed protein product [Mesocestoides corti]
MAVVARLRDLELVNRRLTEEKSRLQRQLYHVLHRLASGQFVRHSGEPRVVSALLREILQSTEFDRSRESVVQAPLASTESSNLMESNGLASITDYSSLSDTFEDIALTVDPVRMVSLEIPSVEEYADLQTLKEPVGMRQSPSSSGASEVPADWAVQFPSSPQSSSYSVESLRSRGGAPQQYPLVPHSETRTAPQTPVISRRPQPSASLPSSPYKYPSRRALRRGVVEVRSKGLETPVEEAAIPGRVKTHRPQQVAYSLKMSPRSKRTDGTAASSPTSLFVPHPLRQALKRTTHKPRVKIGPSEDFLNDFFASAPISGGTVHEEGLHAAIIFGRSAEVARELASLFTHLHSFTCVRNQCFVIQSVPAQELQRNLTYYLQTHGTNFQRLCGEETSSEEARSTAEIPLTTPFIAVPTRPRPSPPPPQPSTSQYRSSSASTEYNIPPTEDSNNNLETERLEILKHNAYHEGRLSKLSSRFKLWQNFWCVLAGKSLFFYADVTEVTNWPRKCIDLAEIQRVESSQSARSIRSAGTSVDHVALINLILRNEKTYTLRSLTSSETRVWETKLRRAVRRVQAERIVQMYSAQLATSGWLRQYRRGQCHRVWGMLMGTFLVYSRDPKGQWLTGFRDLSMTYLRCPAVPEVKPADSSPDNVPFREEYDDYNPSESDSDIGVDEKDFENRTIALWAPNRDPLYLVFPDNVEYDQWKYHLRRACWFPTLTADPGAGSTETGSRFFHLWEQLVRPTYALRRVRSDASLKEPLSRIFESSLEKDAIQLSEKLLLLSTLHTKHQERTPKFPEKSYRLPVDAEKCNSIKEIAQMCFETTSLKDELFLQLIKQATPSAHAFRTLTDVRHSGTEPTRRRASRVVDLLCHRDTAQRRRAASTQRNHAEIGRFASSRGYSQKWIPIIVMWECLAIYSTMFLPSPPVLACLQAYLLQFTTRSDTGPDDQGSSSLGRRSRYAETRRLHNELSRFAAFCSDMLVRCRVRGGRRIVPSYFEVVAISLRNPYTHSLPFSLPIHVHLPSGYEVVSFDGTMKVSQLMASLVSKLGLSEAVTLNLCHCGLYCRISGPQHAFGGVPARPRLIYLEVEWNVCDVISLYESTLTRTDQGSDFSLEDMTIDLVFLIHAVSKKAVVQVSPLTNRIMDIVAHQLHADLYSGEVNLILRGTHYLELTALMCRCDHLDYAELQRRQEVSLTQLVNRYLPHHCLLVWGRDNDQALIELKLLLLERWNKVCLETSSPEDSNELVEPGRPRAAYAYTMYFWRLHPAGACVRHFPCNLVNSPLVPSDETIWLAPSFDKISLLRMYTFDSIVSHPVRSTGIGGTVTGMGCFKQIPLDRVISFGVQQTGAFFLVSSKTSKRRHRRRKTRRHSGVGVSTASTPTASPKNHGVQRRSTSIRESFTRLSYSQPEVQLEKLLFFVRDLCQINELGRVLTFYLENFQ